VSSPGAGEELGKGGLRMNAIAEAAKKRAAKLGIQNQEVDESNAGKGEDPGDLSHPFFGKLKQGGGGPYLSPRSKRLAEMNKENQGDGAAAAENAVPKVAAAPAPAPPHAPKPPQAAAAPPAPQAAPPAPPSKQVNLGAGWSDAAATELKAAVAGGQQQQHKDGLAVIKRWAGR
jgi:hypothetical protein